MDSRSLFRSCQKNDFETKKKFHLHQTNKWLTVKQIHNHQVYTNDIPEYSIRDVLQIYYYGTQKIIYTHEYSSRFFFVSFE